jgi:hypothetical protein
MQLRDDYVEKLQDAIKLWDVEHPIDVWWRDYHQIPFGSSKHLEADFISQHIWYEEQKFMKEIREGKNPHQESANIKNKRVKDIDKETRAMSEKEIDEEFEKLDITKIQQQMDARQSQINEPSKEEKRSTLQSLMDKIKGNK